MKREATFHLWILAFLSFAVTVVCHHLTSDSIELKYLNPPPEKIEWFHFGFRESMADTFWLRWIQNGSDCQTYKGVGPEHPLTPQADEFANPRHKFCDNSWSFKMLDSVTKLAPQFLMPYVTGAIMLSVLVEDYEGAKIIFDRGLAAHPEDWSLAYQASYHYLFDRHDLKRAADLLVQAHQHGGPEWLPLLAARLYSKTGQLQMGISTLELLLKRTTLEKDRQNLEKRIAEMKRQLQP
jgi:hypothetical protein